jgi:hypothetical protein
MTAPFCALCGNTKADELGQVIGICLDKDACHRQQYRNARAAGAAAERQRIRLDILATADRYDQQAAEMGIDLSTGDPRDYAATLAGDQP